MTAPRCPRCGMGWLILVHGSWLCPECKYKQGCCEGPTGEDSAE